MGRASAAVPGQRACGGRVGELQLLLEREKWGIKNKLHRGLGKKTLN